MTGEDGVENTDTFQHVMDKRDDDRSAVDRADKDVKDQIFNQDFEMENQEKDEIEEVKRVKEEKTEQEVASKGEKPEPGGEDDKQATSQDDKDKDFVDTMNVSRGTDSIAVRQEVSDLSSMSNIQVNFDTSLSLQQITLTDNEENDTPVLTQLSHSLSEQLRLILNPTKASSLQGDFRTGKRLNMRKIILFIASDFKKDKIWLRRTKPTKREFQILVALDDSSSMADNKSRQIALTSLNTISSALSLLEAGQLGVLRFGESAEVVHPLNVQWSQTAGHKIQNQFR
jgi:midasin